MTDKKGFKFVFVVLVYRNTTDLEDFFSHFSLEDSKTIVVNSYYDDESKNDFEHLAEKYCADFINVPNKGYAFGNNRGIEYALEHYEFEYLVISNADITIEKFNIKDINSNVVTAPKILNLKGKNQNPSTPFRIPDFVRKLHYKVYKDNKKSLMYLFYALSRLEKILFYIISPLRKTIFAPHGAFFIIPCNILRSVGFLFNENMFLFNEEIHIGYLFESCGVATLYNPNIVIRHKEDGSVKLLNESEFNLMRDSYMEFYEYWFIRK